MQFYYLSILIEKTYLMFDFVNVFFKSSDMSGLLFTKSEA